MLAVYELHSWFWHKAKKQFFDQIWCFFYNKSKILTILFMIKYEKITIFWYVFSVGGAHSQQVICMFKWGKNKQKQQRVLALVLSLWFWLDWARPPPKVPFMSTTNSLFDKLGAYDFSSIDQKFPKPFATAGLTLGLPWYENFIRINPIYYHAPWQPRRVWLWQQFQITPV